VSYIGKQPVVGNFQVCDSISVVNGQAAYTLQVGGSNVEPESPNHMLVSLNGILQAPTTSYTVSGATLTFASNLATNDSIDFVMLLGNVLDIGTPSDSTITSAKLASTFLTGATDVGAAIADADLFLMDDGAGGTLRKTAASRLKTYVGGGLSVADQWRLTSNYSVGSSTTTSLTANLERVDTSGQGGITGSQMSESSGVFTFPSTGIYLVTFDCSFSLSNNSRWIEISIQGTTNNSSYIDLTSQNTNIGQVDGSSTYVTGHTNTLVDVTDTAQVKVMFATARVANSVSLDGNTNSNNTYMTFLRLGDT